ncbi:alpha/beta hydrolase [uncultured Algimonas sp.]|uniref:alpha/beta fold hydrolase n=1 Tax=uncultured Algimonas sp. TaxID=1547920 RepID=UPI002606208B|nr:alpha/beta hydrolase [uncultured Algimonas sp.]
MIRHDEQGADGIRLHWREWDGGTRGTLLFLHGLGADGRQFEGDAAHFADIGYRVLVPDLRGHGRSTPPDPLAFGTLRVARLAADLSPLVVEAAPPVHLIGNSLGGLVALELCGRHPDRIASLCTFGTAYRLAYPPGVAALQYGLARLLGRKRLAALVARQATERARPLLRNMYETADPKVMRAVQQTIRAYDYRETARRFDGPILFLSAEMDKAINRQSAPTLDTLSGKPGFRHAVIPSAGHFANLDRPETFRAVLCGFLTSTEA